MTIQNTDAIDDEFRCAGLEPVSAFTRAGDERECRCTRCGTTRWVRLSNLRKGGVACRWCHGWDTWTPWGSQARTRAAGWKPIGTPEESLELLGSVNLAPITPLGDLYAPVGAVCLTCGETLVTVPERIKSSRSRPGWYSCQRCAADRKQRIREDAPTLFESNGLRLLGPCRGEYVAQHTECMTCGAERWVSYSDLLSGTDAECWTCRTGINPKEPHRVYLFHFADLGVVKVGITHNRDDRRLGDHQFAGGRLVDCIVVPNRAAAQLVEKVICSATRGWSATGVGPEDFPQGGWTETFRDDAPVFSLAAIATAVVRSSTSSRV